MKTSALIFVIAKGIGRTCLDSGKLLARKIAEYIYKQQKKVDI
jgi:hypothetical protein